MPFDADFNLVFGLPDLLLEVILPPRVLDGAYFEASHRIVDLCDVHALGPGNLRNVHHRLK